MSNSAKELKNIPLFSMLSESELREIQPYIAVERFKKKEKIFSEGDPSDWFYILVRGKVKITKLSLEGREIILELISPIEFFGGIAVLNGFPYPANALAMEDSEIIKIARQNLLKILDRFPSMLYSITSSLGHRLKDFQDTLKNVALERVESRIASVLLKLSNKTGFQKTAETAMLDMKLTKQDIADMVGTTVESCIRIMSKLKKAGILGEKSGRIVIKDAEALKKIAGL